MLGWLVERNKVIVRKKMDPLAPLRVLEIGYVELSPRSRSYQLVRGRSSDGRLNSVPLAYWIVQWVMRDKDFHLTIETCGFGFKSLYHHHMQSEKTLSHFLKNPAEAQSLRGFAVFRCCLRSKMAPWKTVYWPVFTLHSPKVVDLIEASLQVWIHINQQLTGSPNVPFFLISRLGKLSNENNSTRLCAGSC